MGRSEDSPPGAYEVGYDDKIERVFDLRSAESHAGFLLPRLRSGMELLDCGCGPGTITAGLARSVAPGRVTGIDIEESQLGLAKRNLAAAGASNVDFEVASVLDLPFHDGSFDVVFFHAVLCHLPAPLDALAEAQRVLKPGGLVAVREPDLSGFYLAPADPTSERIFDLLAAVIESGGGDACLGRRLRTLLHEAEFAHPTASASCNSYGDPESARRKSEVWAGLTSESDMSANAVQLGLFSPDELQEIGAALCRLAEQPDAMIVEAWGEALGWKDERPDDD
jgi:SAM-dependent methyltransferase